MSEWQPIETAPKDGTLVVLSIPCCGDVQSEHPPTLIVGSYYDGHWRDDPETGGSELYPPTHWMPLPPPPATSGTSAEAL